MPQYPTGFSPLTPADLTAPGLFKLNNMLALMWGKLSQQVSGNDLNLGDVTANSLAVKKSITPVADGGASLGSAAFKFLNGFVDALKIGLGGAPAYPLDIRVPLVSQIHVAASDVDDGAWITYSTGTGVYLSMGAIWDGAHSQWVAKHGTAVILGFDSGYNFTLSVGLLLTPGMAFVPGTIFQVALTVGPPATLVMTGTINSTAGYKANGAAGITGIVPLFGPTTNGSITFTDGLVISKTDPT